MNPMMQNMPMNMMTLQNQQQLNYNPYFNRSYQTNNGINWVQGIEGAKAYQLSPNSNTVLLDSDNDGVFYIKVSDNVGMCNLRIFKYVEVTNEQTTPESSINMEDYVRKDELQELLASFTNKKTGGKSNGKQLISTTESTKSVITE